MKKKTNVTKIIVSVLACMFVIGLAGMAISVYRQHTGKNYYVKITDSGTEQENSQIGQRLYQMMSYDEEGNEQQVEFYSMDGKILRLGAYLQIVYNQNNGVVRYMEVAENEVPVKALEQLTKIEWEK